MRIDSSTKISKILKEKPEAIDVIASINSNFKKLQNPILRRSLATRVSVKDAARIGKVDVDKFLKSLEKIGFEIDYQKEDQKPDKHMIMMPPDFSGKEIVTLDVRPIIAEGKDPFGYINKVAKKIEPNQILLIINDFEPIPLIEYLIDKSFVHWMKQDKDGNYLTYFKLNCPQRNFFQRMFGKKIPCQFHSTGKTAQNKQKKESGTHQKIEMPEQNEVLFAQIELQYNGKLKEIDVRNLEMPMPMQTILQEIEKLPKDKALFVHHKRIPQFLLPELKKRNFNCISKRIDADYTYLIIYKKP